MGTTIIDKTKPAAPRYVFEEPPSFKKAIDGQRWAETEVERWHIGYRGLCGRHYFHLTQRMIKDGTEGRLIRPRYREDDEPIFKQIEKTRADGKMLMWLSRREFGKSTILGSEVGYCSAVFPGCVQNVTSADKDRIFSFFNENLLTCVNHMHPLLKPETLNQNNTRDRIYLKLGYETLNERGLREIAESHVFGVETNEKPKSPMNFSGKRLKTGLLDEVALHERLTALIKSANGTVMKGTQRTGLLLFAGTVEEGIKNENIVKLNQLYADKEILDLDVIFTPYYHGLHLNPDGTSDHKKAQEWWENKAEQLSKAKDPSALLAFKKNYPPSIEVALELGGGGTLPAEVIEQVNEQAIFLRNNRDKINIKSCHLVQVGGGKVEARISESGKMRILESPKENVEYIAGTDPIPIANMASEEGSKFVTIVYSMPARTPVAIYAERNFDPMITVRNVIMLCDYYNKAKNMVEFNQGEALILAIKQEGRRDLLSGQPYKSGLAVKVSTNIKVLGYRKVGSDKTVEVLHRLFVDWLLKCVKNIYFEELLEDIPLYLVGNTDFIDALLAALLLENERMKSSAVVQAANQKFKTFTYLEQQGNKTVWKKAKIPIKNI